jgi:DNA repair protein RadC
MIFRYEIPTKITDPDKVSDIIKEYMGTVDPFDRDKEYSFVIGLDSGNHVKFIEITSMGGLTSTVVTPREVFRRAIIEACAGIVIIHNHPSGEANPSGEDRRMSGQLVKVSEIVGIPVIDFIIWTVNGFMSFAREGILSCNKPPVPVGIEKDTEF